MMKSSLLKVLFVAFESISTWSESMLSCLQSKILDKVSLSIFKKEAASPGSFKGNE